MEIFENSKPVKSVPLKISVTLCVWLGVVSLGWVALAAYSGTAGTSQPVPIERPIDSRLKFTPDSLNVILFLHPKCSCSHATVNLYRDAISFATLPVQTQFVFFCPKNEGDDWVMDRLWNSAKPIPSSSRLIDRAGEEAKRFNINTSGHVLVYDREGILVFGGGITTRRGHEGTSLGSETLRKIVQGKPFHKLALPVFGCPIFAATDLGKGTSDE